MSFNLREQQYGREVLPFLSSYVKHGLDFVVFEANGKKYSLNIIML
jgi:hypothetical protein